LNTEERKKSQVRGPGLSRKRDNADLSYWRGRRGNGVSKGGISPQYGKKEEKGKTLHRRRHSRPERIRPQGERSVVTGKIRVHPGKGKNQKEKRGLWLRKDRGSRPETAKRIAFPVAKKGAEGCVESAASFYQSEKNGLSRCRYQPCDWKGVTIFQTLEKREGKSHSPFRHAGPVRKTNPGDLLISRGKGGRRGKDSHCHIT